MEIDSQRPFLKESMHKPNRPSENLAGGAKMKNTAFLLFEFKSWKLSCTNHHCRAVLVQRRSD